MMHIEIFKAWKNKLHGKINYLEKYITWKNRLLTIKSHLVFVGSSSFCSKVTAKDN